jgi:CRP-like cAMP-binding protein
VCYEACEKEITKGMVNVSCEMSPRSLAKLSELGEPYQVPALTCVVKQHSHGQNMYLVLDGELEVRRPEGKDKHVVLARLARGNYFGEMALVNADAGRRADVVATTDAALVRLNETHLKKTPEVGALVYRELAKIFSIRLRRITQIYMQTVARNCHLECPIVKEAPASGA